VSSSEVVNTLRNYHALLVPSRGLETGPLVMLEAFAAGIPVVGSRLGGIAEWVTHQENGLLVNAPTATAWCDALKRLTMEPELIAELTRGVRAPRSMSEVAAETQAIYAELLK
jgi:glycosyltransferase involved in cell wall biosynthesis